MLLFACTSCGHNTAVATLDLMESELWLIDVADEQDTTTWMKGSRVCHAAEKGPRRDPQTAADWMIHCVAQSPPKIT